MSWKQHAPCMTWLFEHDSSRLFFSLYLVCSYKLQITFCSYVLQNIDDLYVGWDKQSYSMIGISHGISYPTIYIRISSGINGGINSPRD